MLYNNARRTSSLQVKLTKIDFPIISLADRKDDQLITFLCDSQSYYLGEVTLLFKLLGLEKF